MNSMNNMNISPGSQEYLDLKAEMERLRLTDPEFVEFIQEQSSSPLGLLESMTTGGKTRRTKKYPSVFAFNVALMNLWYSTVR